MSLLILSIILSNQTKFGGGVYIANTLASMSDVIIINNHAESKGGGLWIGNESEISCNKTIFANNYSEGFGGAIFLSNSLISLDKATVTNNIVSSAVAGAGIYADGGDAVITNSIVYYNRRVDDNSSIYNLSGYSGDFLNEFQITYSDIEYPTNLELNGLGIISENPGFVNFEFGIYELESDSPCIDSGNPESVYDSDGTVSDMGAIFFNQSSEMGDINGDGSIDVLDVVLLVTVILDNQESSVDLNFDGLTNIQDIVILITMILEF